jgi:hypothetical protein
MAKLLLALVVVAVGGYFGAKLYLDHKVTKSLDEMIVAVRPVAEMSYGEATATMSGEIRVEDVTLRFPGFGDTVHIDRVSLVTPGVGFLWKLGGNEPSLELPDRLGIDVDGLRMSVDADFVRELSRVQQAQFVEVEQVSAADICVGNYGFTPETLHELGYSELVAHLYMGFEQESDELVINVATNVEDMYDFDLALTLGGMRNPTALVRGGYRPVLIGGSLDYIDRSLKSRVMKLCTEQYDLSEGEVIEAQLAALKTLASDSGLELDALILEPYTDFLLTKQSFSLTSEPFQPLDLAELGLYKPSDVPNLLNLVAEAR